MRNVYVLLQLVGVVIAVYAFTATTQFGFQKYDAAERLILVLVGIIALVAGGILYRKETKRLHEEKSLKSCPFCAEKIHAEAKICKHCGKDLYEKGA